HARRDYARSRDRGDDAPLCRAARRSPRPRRWPRRGPRSAAMRRVRPGDAVGVGAVGLRTRRVRATLTALGISIGIAAMVAVLGISASSKADLLGELDRLGTNLLQVTPGQSFFGRDAKLPTDAPAMIRRVG